jgi:hypothetical protein
MSSEHISFDPFDLRILITPFVYFNCSYYYWVDVRLDTSMRKSIQIT